MVNISKNEKRFSWGTPKTNKTKYVGIIGSRQLSHTQSKRVGDITKYLVTKKYHIASGGAIGADQFVIEHLLRNGYSNKCTVFSAWKYYKCFPKTIQAMMKQFKEYGGKIQWGLCGEGANYSVARVALLERNVRLVKACYGVVAFIDKNSRGSIFTIKQAIKQKKKVVVFPIDCELPKINDIVWRRIKCTGPWAGSYVAKSIYEAN
jgi:predicted Rossmann fold nucleotide-binding protein DprA/Smf involved in DNA uptake